MRRASRTHADRSRRADSNSSRRGGDRDSGGRTPVAQVHRSAGNQAVQRATKDRNQGQSQDQKRIGEHHFGRGYEEPTAAERDRAVSEADFRAVIRASLENRGISPPSGGLTLDDYITTDMVISSEGAYPTTKARIRVGPDGNLLPSIATIEARRPESGYGSGSLQTATTWIAFEVSRIPDGGLYVQAVKQKAKERQGKTIFPMTAAADKTISIRDQTPDPSETEGTPPYSMPDDERVPGLVNGLLETAGIKVGAAAPMTVPGNERGDGKKPTETDPKDPNGPKSPKGPKGPKSPKDPKTPAGTPVPSKTTGDRGRGTTYEVQPGDTLWGIAERFYGDGRKWRVIYEANPTKIEDPDLIQPEQDLRIPPKAKAEQFDRSEYEDPRSAGLGKGTF